VGQNGLVSGREGRVNGREEALRLDPLESVKPLGRHTDEPSKFTSPPPFTAKSAGSPPKVPKILGPWLYHGL